MRQGANCRSGVGAWSRPALFAGLLGAVVLAVLWGRSGFLARATALPPAAKSNEKGPEPPLVPQLPSDYSRRVVAYIYGNVPITREQLGEYLIARQGAERLELMVNKIIIDHVCRQKGIEVTAAEIDAALAEDLKGMGTLTQKDFVDKVLKRYGKTLYEWKEDVIRPKLALIKLCRDEVHVTEQDLKDAFEAHYGAKVKCQIIIWPKGEEKHVMDAYPRIRDSAKQFDDMAKRQASPRLAASCGHLDRPISHHSTGNEELEKEAFSLKPGEVGRLLDAPEGLVVLKCLETLPPESDRKFETERAALEKEVFDKKVQQQLATFFKKLREEAHPKLFLKQYESEEDWLRDVREEISSGTGPENAPARTPPHAN